MPRQALIDGIPTGTVVNLIELENGADWQPPANHQVVPSDTANIGDTWDGAQFIPGPVQPPTAREEALARLQGDIPANKATGPWGPILYDLGIVSGIIEPGT